MHRADSRAGQHRNRRLGNVRQINDDAITFFDVVPFQHIRETADFAMQLLIRERALIAGFAFPNYCGLVPTRSGEMPVQAIFRNVQFPADEPFREWRFPFEDFFPRRAPDQLPRFACPELGRLLDRFSMHSPILSQALDPRFTPESRCWLENAFFDQMRFNVVVPEQSLICARTFQGKRASSVATGSPQDESVRCADLWPVKRRWLCVGRPTGLWLHVKDARTTARRLFHARSVATGPESVHSGRSASGRGGC